MTAGAWCGAQPPAPAAPGAPAPAAPVPPADGSGPKTVLLSLDEALRLGTGESETVWIAKAGVMRAVGSEQVSRSGLFPQLSGSASYTRTLRSQFSGLSFGPPGG